MSPISKLAERIDQSGANLLVDMPSIRPTVASIEKRWRAGPWFFAVLAMVVVALAEPSHGSAAVTIGGPFELVAPNGKIVTDQTFRGKWLLVYFGYTSCPESCPVTLVEIAKALTRLGAAAAKVQPLFITLDPRHDTRELIGEYTGSFDRRILGLTGTPRQIAAAVKAYGVYVQPADLESDGSSPRLDHSTYVYLMGPDGRFERALDHEPPADDIAAAVRAEMSRASGHGSDGRTAEPRSSAR